MPNTYTQIYIHIVFAVKNRDALISTEWKERLHKYITGIVQNQRHKLIAVNTMPNHAHIFIGLRPDAALSDIVRDIKKKRRTSLTGKSNRAVLLPGRWGLERFHIPTRKLVLSSNTY